MGHGGTGNRPWWSSDPPQSSAGIAARCPNVSRGPEILKRVSADRAYWTLVEVGAEVLAAAEKLVAVHPVRTLDAIHVASAQVFAAGVSGSDLMFVSADKRQTEAATVIGLTTQYIRS